MVIYNYFNFHFISQNKPVSKERSWECKRKGQFIIDVSNDFICYGQHGPGTPRVSGRVESSVPIAPTPCHPILPPSSSEALEKRGKPPGYHLRNSVFLLPEER